jgi:hypothetical protein
MSDEITIRFTPQQLDAVANALGHRPYIEAAPVLDAISKQVAAHNASLPPANGPAPGPGDADNVPALP